MPGSVVPVVGVVIPAYNAEMWLAQTVDTLLDQTLTTWKCVIVDDGSTDSTAAIADRLSSRDPRIQVLHQANSGSPSARNAGIAALAGDCQYIAFLDSDDLYEPDALESLVAALADRPDAVGAYGLADYIDDKGRALLPGLHPSRQRDRRTAEGWRLRSVPADADAAFSVLVVGGPIWPPAVAIQRMDVVLATGGFDTSFPSQEDWDLYLRLARHGAFVAVDRRLAWYRRHDSNLTVAHEISVYQQERVRRNTYLAEENSAEQVRQTVRAWRHLEARQSLVLARHTLRCLRTGAWRGAASAAVGATICAMIILRPGPPPASHRRVRFTRPATLPGAVLLPTQTAA